MQQFQTPLAQRHTRLALPSAPSSLAASMIIRISAIIGLLHGLSYTTASTSEQIVMDQGIQDSFVRPEGTLPTLADLLTVEGRASIFYSYARETEMSERFTKNEGTTLFVPTNKAVQALSRKPHEDPKKDSAKLSNAEYEAISKSNVQRWVGAHIIPSPNVDFNSTQPYKTMTPGATITFKPISSAYHPPGEPTIDTDAAHFINVKGGVPDTDAAHFASIKGPASPSSQVTSEEPTWKKYEVNDGVYIIEEKKASNGIMYLMDGTVPV